MEAVETKEEEGLALTPDRSEPASRPVGIFRERSFLGWGLAGSGILHVVGILVLVSFLQHLGGVQSLRNTKPLEVLLEEPELTPLFPDEEPEPELTPDEEPEPNEEPELVERPEPPKELPPDPPAPDPLDWLPPVDLLADLDPWLDLTEPEPVTPQPEPPVLEPPAPAPPVVLEGKSLPGFTKSPRPDYPRMAQRMGWQGTVTLRVVVDAEGGVVSGVVELSSGHDILDEAALEAFLLWIFDPRREGEPDHRIVRKKFTFKLP